MGFGQFRHFRMGVANMKSKSTRSAQAIVAVKGQQSRQAAAAHAMAATELATKDLLARKTMASSAASSYTPAGGAGAMPAANAPTATNSGPLASSAQAVFDGEDIGDGGGSGGGEDEGDGDDDGDDDDDDDYLMLDMDDGEGVGALGLVRSGAADEVNVDGDGDGDKDGDEDDDTKEAHRMATAVAAELEDGMQVNSESLAAMLEGNGWGDDVPIYTGGPDTASSSEAGSESNQATHSAATVAAHAATSASVSVSAAAWSLSQAGIRIDIPGPGHNYGEFLSGLVKDLAEDGMMGTRERRRHPAGRGRGGTQAATGSGTSDSESLRLAHSTTESS